MALKFSVVISIVIFTCLQMEMYSAIKIDINPTRFTGNNEQNVKLSCMLDEAEASAKEIMALKIARKGEKAIVILHPNNTISYITGTRQEFSATGKIVEPVIKSYLNVVLKKPDVDDTGTYTCNIYYMDESGVLAEDKASSFLTVNDPEVKNFKIQIDELKATIRSLSVKINQFQSQSPMIAFSATNEVNYIKAYQGHRLIFPDLITSVGTGYNQHTGAFRVPVGGLYHFSLMLKLSCVHCYVRVKLVTNSFSLFRLKVGTVYDQSQGSASSVVNLQEGNIVYPYVDYATSGTSLTPSRLCFFSGFLIRAE